MTVSRPPLVLLHGWGLNRHVWAPIVPSLSQDYDVHALDLPGFGDAAYRANGSEVEDYADALRGYVPAGAIVVGWSLGGMVGIALAHRYPDLVKRLVLVASSPRFVQEAGWNLGATPELMDDVTKNHHRDHATALRDALCLQLQGSQLTLREKKALIDSQLKNIKKNDALLDGLKIIRYRDLRPELAALSQPVDAIFGELDSLIPHAHAGELDAVIGAGKTHIVQGGSHAPFLSRPQEFLTALKGITACHN